MRTSVVSGGRLFCALLGAVLFTSDLFGDGLLERLLPQNDLETITVTEATPAGLLRRQPTPTNPVYYAAVSAGYRDFGGVKAGEKPIAREQVNRTMLKALAKQGYLPATENQVPEIVLVWAWGTFNAERFLGPNGFDQQLNQRQMLRFLGGEKLGLVSRESDAFPEQFLMPGLFHQGSDAAALSGVAEDDLYVAVVAAYDIRLWGAERPERLWVTRISCPSRGFWLPEALPAMLAIAGPHLGRETPEPVWIRATDKFKPEIILGDTTVVEYLENNPAAIVEVGPSQ